MAKRNTAGRSKHDNRPNRESVKKRIGVRKARFIAERDGHACIYCRATEGPMHLDHVVAKALGGEDRVDNLVVACASCNCVKKHLTIRQWYGYLRVALNWTKPQTDRVARRVRRHLAKPYPGK